MSLRHALLGVLEARPMTGYELSQFFDHSAAWVWSAPHSNIYPALRKMEAEGLLQAQTDIKGEKLERTSYSITSAGRRELRDWVASDPGMPVRDPLLLQLIFVDLVDPEEADKLLQLLIVQQQHLRSQWIRHAEALRAKDTPLLRERLKSRPAAEHDRIATVKARVFDLMIAQASTLIDWATETMEVLDDDVI